MNAYAQVFFTFTALLLAQLAIPFELQFVQGRNVISPVMLVFAGLGAGQLIYLAAARRTSQILEYSHPAFLLLVLAPLFAVFNFLPRAAPPAAAIIFVIFGVMIARLYRRHQQVQAVGHVGGQAGAQGAAGQFRRQDDAALAERV